MKIKQAANTTVYNPILLNNNQYDFLSNNNAIVGLIPINFWNRYDLNPYGTDFIQLKNSNNTYLTCDSAGNVGGAGLVSSFGSLFTPVLLGANIFSFRNYYGAYIGINSAGTVTCSVRYPTAQQTYFNTLQSSGTCSSDGARFLIFQNVANGYFLSSDGSTVTGAMGDNSLNALWLGPFDSGKTKCGNSGNGGNAPSSPSTAPATNTPTASNSTAPTVTPPSNSTAPTVAPAAGGSAASSGNGTSPDAAVFNYTNPMAGHYAYGFISNTTAANATAPVFNPSTITPAVIPPSGANSSDAVFNSTNPEAGHYAYGFTSS